MKMLWHRRDGDHLLVLLPGAYMAARDYADNGVFDAMDGTDLALDLCVMDLDLMQMSAGDALAAITRTILEPARAAYRSVWLGGISFGGMLALCQKVDRPTTVDGLCLLAPYPGCRLTTLTIERAGGLDAWQPTAEQLADHEFRAWRWLKAPPSDCPAFVGYGIEDRFAGDLHRLAERFPASARHTVAGGHDWAAWRPLWGQFLDFAGAAGHFRA